MDDHTLALIIIGDMTLTARKMEAEILALREQVMGQQDEAEGAEKCQ